MSDDVRDYLAKDFFGREAVEHYLDPDYAPMWARFDPELGYVLRGVMLKQGLDKCYSIENYEEGGQRRVIQYRDQPCRINTYGDSFTQCAQVSDGETWQEYLAAHLGEPIRNFGVGGYGFYQAYRRAVRVEATELSAPYIVLNIYHDDHTRSLDASMRVRKMSPNDADPLLFAGTPWVHVRYDLEGGRFVERPSLCPTPDALRELCDPRRVYEAFKDDPIVRLKVLQLGGRVQDVEDLQALAEVFDVDADLADPARSADDAYALHMAYALRSTEFVLDLARESIASTGKKLLVLLSYGHAVLPHALQGEPRFDQSLIDYLQRNNVPYVDGLQRHIDDFKVYRLSPAEYIDRYYIGHYSPSGNHFFAFAVKDAFVDWLDPTPLAYQPGAEGLTEEAARLACTSGRSAG